MPGSTHWLGLYFPDLAIEVHTHGEPVAAGFVVSHRAAGQERVYRCNASAMARGIRVGMSLAAALALQEGLQVVSRDFVREQQALEDLAAWAYQFSDHVCFDPRCLLLEVGGSLRLFGGIGPLLARVQRELPQLGFRARHAMAPTPAAAALLARVSPGARVEEVESLRAAVADIPLARFTRQLQARELMRGVGLRTLGECLRLPRPELARRIGPDLGAALDRLLGLAPDPRPPWTPPAVFVASLDLLAEVTSASALVFPARRLIIMLCGFLRGRGAAAQDLQWTLHHRDVPDSGFTQGLLSPSRDAGHMIELLRERVSRLQLDAAVTGLGLRVENRLDFEETSGDLFGRRTADTADLLERLRARLGSEAVWRLEVVADHRPERAWRLCEPVPGRCGDMPADRPAAAAMPCRPLWLLESPRPLVARGGVPEYGGPLTLSDRVERIEAGWWDGGDVARDYYVALSPAGERLWVFRDRRARCWYLHGRFD
jgi:protein ImuB